MCIQTTANLELLDSRPTETDIPQYLISIDCEMIHLPLPEQSTFVFRSECIGVECRVIGCICWCEADHAYASRSECVGVESRLVILVSLVFFEAEHHLHVSRPECIRVECRADGGTCCCQTEHHLCQLYLATGASAILTNYVYREAPVYNRALYRRDFTAQPVMCCFVRKQF